MKNKTKLVVALASLLAVTGGVGAYSTFAWFTTTRVATVNVSSATVYSNYGKLLVAYPHTATEEQPLSTGGSTTQPAQGTKYTFTQASTAVDGIYTVTGIDLAAITKNMTDISGSGLATSFFKPVWIPGSEGTGASAIPSALNGTTLAGAASTDSYYTAFNLEFWNTGSTAINIYLNSTTALAAHTGDTGDQLTKDNAAKSATRVAVYDGTTQVSVWQQETDANGYKFISAAAGSELGSFGTYTTLTADSGKFHVGAYAAVQKDFTANAGQEIVTSLAANSSKVLTFTMWIEGTATAAVNAAIGGKVDLALNFAALEA